MAAHITTFVQRMLAGLVSRGHIEELLGQLTILDVRDFEGSVQADLLLVRADLRRVLASTVKMPRPLREYIEPLVPILEKYKGEGSRGVVRQFGFLSDPELKAIVERDYAELRLRLFPGHAWKSTVIIAGSILEAILLDRLNDPSWHAKAVASPKPINTKGQKIPKSDWTLGNMIDVAQDIGLLQPDPANTVHQVLRDYRNFVHPKKEIRSAHPCTEAEAMLAVGALDSVCNFLETHP